MELVSNRHLSSISCKKCRYVGGKDMYFMTANTYVEFSYNNSYQESLKMAPFEMLYGCRCRTPLFWTETGEQKVFRPDILQ
jgi:hypothetical protein